MKGKRDRNPVAPWQLFSLLKCRFAGVCTRWYSGGVGTRGGLCCSVASGASIAPDDRRNRSVTFPSSPTRGRSSPDSFRARGHHPSASSARPDTRARQPVWYPAALKCGDLRLRTACCTRPPTSMLTAPQGAAEAQRLRIRDREMIHDAQGRASRSPTVSPLSCMPCSNTAPRLNRHTRRALAGEEIEPSSRAKRRPREGVDDGADSVAFGQLADCDFNRAALHPADPIKCQMST